MANSKVRYKKSLSKQSKAKNVVRKKIKQSRRERDQKLLKRKIDSDNEDSVTDELSNVPTEADFGADMDENVVADYFGEDFLEELDKRVKRQEEGEEVLEPREPPKLLTEEEAKQRFGEPVFQESSSESEEDEENQDTSVGMDGTEFDEQNDEEEEEEDPIEGLKRFRAELQEIAEEDPNFEEYMSKQEYEQTLEKIDQELKKAKEGPKKKIVTLEVFQDWLDSAHEDKTIGPLRKCLLIFRLVCNPSSGEEAEEAPLHIQEDQRDAMFVVGLQDLVELFNNFLDRHPSDEVPPNENSKWKRISSYVMAFCTNSVRYLQEHTDVSGKMLLAFAEALPFFGVHLSKAKLLLRIVLKLVPHEKEDVRVRAFYLLHQMATKFPYPFISACMKGIYSVYTKHCYPMQPQNYGKVIFLVNCVTQLFTINADCAYQHAYVYLRFVAMALRNGLAAVPRKMKSKGKTKTGKSKKHSHPLASWKYVNLLRVWTDVICHMPKENELGELIYPLVQIILGTFKLCAEVKHLPIRLLLVSFLNKISKCCGVYIPVVPHLLEILASQAISSKPTTTCKSPPDLLFHLQFDSKMMSTLEYKTAVSKEVVFLLLESLTAHSNYIAFPEMTDATLKALRKFKSRDDFGARQYRKKVVQLIQVIEENNQVIFQKRASSGMAPKDVEKAATLMSLEETPLSKKYKVEAHNREEHTKMVFSSLKKADITGEDSGDETRIPLVSETALKKKAENKRLRQKKRRKAKREPKVKQMSQVYKSKRNNTNSTFNYEKKKGLAGQKRKRNYAKGGPAKKRAKR